MPEIDEGQRYEIEEMYNWLCDFSPADTGPRITHKLRRGKKYVVCGVRLYVPTDDEFSWGVNFAERYAAPSERFVDHRGQIWSGKELLQKAGVLVGNDAKAAIEGFLHSAAGTIPATELMALGERFGIKRGVVAGILGDSVGVWRMRKKMKLVAL